MYKGNNAQAGPQAGAGCVLGLGWRQPAVALRPSPRVKRARRLQGRPDCRFHTYVWILPLPRLHSVQPGPPAAKPRPLSSPVCDAGWVLRSFQPRGGAAGKADDAAFLTEGKAGGIAAGARDAQSAARGGNISVPAAR